jgi:hypothetical protein
MPGRGKPGCEAAGLGAEDMSLLFKDPRSWRNRHKVRPMAPPTPPIWRPPKANDPPKRAVCQRAATTQPGRWADPALSVSSASHEGG